MDPGQRIASADALLDALPAEPETMLARTASGTQLPAPAPAPLDSELAAVMRFLQRRFGSRKTEQPEGSVVHSSLRERAIVWTLLVLLLTATVTALIHSQ